MPTGITTRGPLDAHGRHKNPYPVRGARLMPRKPGRASVWRQRNEQATGSRRAQPNPPAHQCPRCGRQFVRSDWAAVHRCNVSVSDGDRHKPSTSNYAGRHDLPDSDWGEGHHPSAQHERSQGSMATDGGVPFWDWQLRPGTEDAAFPRVTEMHLGPSCIAGYSAMMDHIDSACAPLLRRVLADGAPTYPPLVRFEEDMARQGECVL